MIKNLSPEQKARIEAFKELARLAIFFSLSWVFTEVLSQASMIPDKYDLKVWEFVFAIPVRSIVIFAITGLQRYLDKYRHVFGKEESILENEYKQGKSMGLTGF